MKDSTEYYAKEITRLESKEHACTELIKKSTQCISIMAYLIESKGMDNLLTREIKSALEVSLDLITKFDNDLWNGECPYNDPTLDLNDPYYMRKPLGNTPEELSSIAQHMANKSETISGMVAQSLEEPVYAPGEQERKLRKRIN